MSWLKLIKLRERCFSSCHDCGTKEKFWVPTRNWTSDLWIPRSDSPSCHYLQTWLYRHCWSLQYAGRVSYELSNRSNSQWYEHRSAESDGLRFDSSWGAKIFSLSNARERMKNIFLYFFTEPKTYPPSYSIGKTCWKIATGNNQVYLHITFGGIFTIHQGLISCPLHWKTALKISNITFLKQLKNYRRRPVKDSDI